MKLRARILTAALALLLAASPPAAGQESAPVDAAPGEGAAAPETAVDGGPVPAFRLTAALDTTATTVGGRLRLTVDWEGDASWQVLPPERSAELGSFRVRSVEEALRTDTQRRLVYTLVAVEAGEVAVPPLSFTVQRGDGEPVEAFTEPIPVSVASNLAPPPAEGAPAPAPDEAADPGTAPADGPLPADYKPMLDAPRDWRPIWIAALAALIAAVAGFFLLRALRKLRARPREAAPEPVAKAPTRPAWEIALEELDAVREADWVGRNELGRQYDDVTEALRRYVENRYGVPALESTTDDLRDLLRRSAMPGDVAGRALSLLAEADLVKFAKGIPDPDSARSSETRARAIVEETIPAPETRQEEAA